LKTLTISITLLVAVLLSSSGLLVTHATTPNSIQNLSSSQSKQTEKLSLGIQGVISSAGSQTWSLSGGSLVGAQFGQEQVPPNANLQYMMRASVNGLSASGSVRIALSGTTVDGQSINFRASGPIVGMIPSICFPSYASPDANGNCPSTDTSAIPAFFVAEVSTTETLGSNTTTGLENLLIESPILNPFAAPIAIMSTDGSIAIIATYQTGSATWSNVQVMGTVSGTFNGNSASGSFSQVANAVENFVTGKENELGSVAFQNMSTSSLNARGLYVGTSTVPTAGSFDCAAMAGLPEGTCTETGLASTGTFIMLGSSGSNSNSAFLSGTTIVGSYTVNWPAPSITFSGTIAATVTTQ
jgi:hypothetical protein